MRKIINNNLKTPEYELLNKECPLNEYPRPQFKRESYISLNGEWDYLLTDKLDLSLKYEGKILVPYCIESYLSKINYCYPITTNYFIEKSSLLMLLLLKIK